MLADKSFLSSLGISRDNLFITTKLSPGDQAKEQCRNSVLTSLEKLKLDFIDLVLIHWPGSSGIDPKSPKNAELRKKSWLDLEQLCREKKIRAIGVSNYTIKHLTELLDYCSIKPTVNQVEFHPFLNQNDLLTFCKEQHIVLQAYSSLGSSDGWKTLSQLSQIIEVADNREKSIAQVLLRWALQHEIPVIPKTSRIEKLRDNFDLFSFSLNDEEMKQFDSLDKQQHFCWNPDSIL